MEAVATLPDGTQTWLFRIPEWDFDWQGDYAYVNPVFLPKGATLSMIYTYDNSTNNLRNPNQPPRRVRYGLNSTDEMAELWLQVLPRGTNALAVLENDQKPRVLNNGIVYNTYLLGLDPNNARAHTELGRTQIFLGHPEEALPHLRKAIELQPEADEAHYALGLLFRMQNQPTQAKAEFQTAVRLNPDHFKAYGNLGLLLLEEGDLDDAQFHFEAALRIQPDDAIAKESLLGIARKRAGQK
jgi:tetratricopeptide (TPR) repeat protein